MSGKTDTERRLFLTGAAALGTGIAAFASTREAMGETRGGETDPGSVLDKVRKGEPLQVGFAQTPVWFYRDPKTGDLRGIYKDLVELLAKDLKLKVAWHEVTFANLTLGLAKGDYDLFGSSAVYTVPRAMVANYVGPLWSKGSLAVVRKKDAGKFKTVADLDRPDVIFSVNAGASEEQRMPQLFAKAKFIAVAGQMVMAAEPVRTGRATVFVTGDSDALAFAKRNATWAHIIDPEHPFDKRPNTWVIRYGDQPWKHFLDMWSTYVTVNGEVKRLYDKYIKLLT